jgi:hypothetical protein
MPCQRIRTKQANNRSHAILAEPDTTSCRWLIQLDDVYKRFTYVNPTTQPSASSGCNSRNHARPLTGFDVPHKVATLSERLAPRRYRRRTALRLRRAEPPVLSATKINSRKTITCAAFAAFACICKHLQRLSFCTVFTQCERGARLSYLCDSCRTLGKLPFYH